MTPTTKTPLPTLITISWKDGTPPLVIESPQVIGEGQARDVLGGSSCAWVIKIQESKWHVSSNGAEYRIATGVLKPFTPVMAGCVLCEYKSIRGTLTLSALVVARVSTTVDAYFKLMFPAPPTTDNVSILLGLVQSFFELVHEVCGKRRTKLTDLHTKNIGIRDDSGRVVLLDVETAAEETGALVAGDWGQKSRRASAGVKSFFESLTACSQQQTVQFGWKQVVAVVVDRTHTA